MPGMLSAYQPGDCVKIEFKGIVTKENELSGVISSSEIILHFSDAWIPGYQRQRLKNSNKISALKNVFIENKSINAVQFQFKGKITKSKADPTDMILDGDLEVMDGQQRIYALYESGVETYMLPVQIYINREKEEEVEMFHRYNTSTSLNLADYMLSFNGPMAKFIQRQMKKTPKSDPNHIPLSRTGNASGLAVGTGGVLLFWSYYHMICMEPSRIIPRTKALKVFFQDETISDTESKLTAFAYQNLCNTFVSVFGEFDHSASAYKRAFFLAWNLLMVRNFMDRTGHIDIRKFKAKAMAINTELFDKAKFKEIKLGFSDESIEQIYDMLIRHFNHKLQKDHLPKFAELLEKHDELVYQQALYQKEERRRSRAGQQLKL